MRLTPGNELAEQARREVLAAYGYRWTYENHDRALRWLGAKRPPTTELVSDVEWLASYAFYITKDGYLSRSRRFAIPLTPREVPS